MYSKKAQKNLSSVFIQDSCKISTAIYFIMFCVEPHQHPTNMCRTPPKAHLYNIGNYTSYGRQYIGYQTEAAEARGLMDLGWRPGFSAFRQPAVAPNSLMGGAEVDSQEKEIIISGDAGMDGFAAHKLLRDKSTFASIVGRNEKMHSNNSAQLSARQARHSSMPGDFEVDESADASPWTSDSTDQITANCIESCIDGCGGTNCYDHCNDRCQSAI